MPVLGTQDLGSNDVEGPSGLVFRENKFASDPVLPFNVFAMPGYADVNNGRQDNLQNGFNKSIMFL
jgi:hypothetical protein